MISIDSLLSEGLPGKEIKRKTLGRSVPQAWKFWKSDNSEWAIFPVAGEHISNADQHGVKAARTHALSPVFIAPDYKAVKALAPHYLRLRPFLICEIAGRGHLILPPKVPRPSRICQDACPTRVPHDLIRTLTVEANVSAELLSPLRRLERQYRALRRRRPDMDQREEVILLQYAETVLDQLGLRKAAIKATRMVRTLERGGLGASRDHFFHSFQNYFLGLLATSRLRPHFQAYRERARLHWDVDPCDVWFLTAMWHDVGYPFQEVREIVNSAFGYETQDEVAVDLKETFLQRAETREALRTLSSLLAHLLDSGRARTQWMKPGPNTNLGASANRIHDALSENVRRSHGAFGAIRLYCDYSDDLDKMEPAARDVLLQTVYLASCSIPFHDWSFPSDVRRCRGDCRIATAVLPFAALLAFVDSIQDDRRDLVAGEKASLILERLVITEPAIVEAKINMHALGNDNLLGKIIEARDVLASLEQCQESLYFKYPQWMAG